MVGLTCRRQAIVGKANNRRKIAMGDPFGALKFTDMVVDVTGADIDDRAAVGAHVPR